jgi:hypothetical protein
MQIHNLRPDERYSGLIPCLPGGAGARSAKLLCISENLLLHIAKNWHNPR